MYDQRQLFCVQMTHMKTEPLYRLNIEHYKLGVSQYKSYKDNIQWWLTAADCSAKVLPSLC